MSIGIFSERVTFFFSPVIIVSIFELALSTHFTNNANVLLFLSYKKTTLLSTESSQPQSPSCTKRAYFKNIFDVFGKCNIR